ASDRIATHPRVRRGHVRPCLAELVLNEWGRSMPSSRKGIMTRLRLLLSAAMLSLFVAGCGGSGSPTTPPPPPPPPPPTVATVTVTSATTSLTVGGTAQATATLRDAN